MRYLAASRDTAEFIVSRAIHFSASLDEILTSNTTFLDGLASRKPPAPELVEAVFEKTCEEHQIGFMSDFHSRADLVALYAAGKWAAMMRFPV